MEALVEAEALVEVRALVKAKAKALEKTATKSVEKRKLLSENTNSTHQVGTLS